MSIAVSCPECGKSYNLADTQRGKTVVCRGCDASFVCEEDRPRRSRRDEEDERPRRRRDEEEEERPRRSRRDEDEDDRRDPDRKPRRRDRDEDEEEEERPRAKKKGRSSGGGGMMWLLLGGGGLVLLLAVGLVVVFATGALGNSRVTQENYQKLKHGMSQKEVEVILGSGKDITKQYTDEIEKAEKAFGMKGGFKINTTGLKMLQWESGKNKIQVTLVNDKAAGFAGEFEVKGGMIKMKN